jgi:hypothetical protein
MSDNVPLRMFFAGTACSVATLVTNPFDVIKVHSQIAKDQKRSLPQIVRQFVAEKGVTGLWAGLPAALIRAYFYTGTRIGVYGPMKTLVGAGDEPTKVQKFAAGCCSGAVAATVGNPFEAVKVRMQAEPGRYKSTTQVRSDSFPVLLDS